MTVEHIYRYLHESSYAPRTGVGLATAGGRVANPYFFRGFIDNAGQAARGLLAVAEVSRTRYFDAGAAQRMRDPVVTSNGSVLRFESFSACNGVYARLDLDESGFDSEYIDWGTTNVDVNEPLRAALTGVGAGEPLRLSVGNDALGVETLDAAIIERKVPLPSRWLRGFAEVQIASSAMQSVAELGTAAARAVVRDLPGQRAGNRPMWLQFSRSGARLTQRPDSTTASLVGPQRLAALRRVAPDVATLRVFATPDGGRSGAGRVVLRPSAWVLGLDRARLTLVISPELYRGFSGEGSVLDALAGADDGDVEQVSRSLAGQASLDPAAWTDAGTGGPKGVRAPDPSRVLGALRVLGAAGRVGHDLHSDGFFHRDLPFDRSALEDMHPRLVDARRLVAQNAVETNGSKTTVRSGDVYYTIGESELGETCTCAWFAKHRGERGPCKHILAVELVAARVAIVP